jgi:hypothetical protein
MTGIGHNANRVDPTVSSLLHIVKESASIHFLDVYWFLKKASPSQFEELLQLRPCLLRSDYALSPEWAFTKNTFIAVTAFDNEPVLLCAMERGFVSNLDIAAALYPVASTKAKLQKVIDLSGVPPSLEILQNKYHVAIGSVDVRFAEELDAFITMYS